MKRLAQQFYMAQPQDASLEHEYWKHIVAEQYRNKGYTVEEEVSIGDGKAVDLVAFKDGRRIAIEVETGKSDVDGNIKKCQKAGFDKLVVVPTKNLRGGNPYFLAHQTNPAKAER